MSLATESTSPPQSAQDVRNFISVYIKYVIHVFYFYRRTKYRKNAFTRSFYGFAHDGELRIFLSSENNDQWVIHIEKNI